MQAVKLFVGNIAYEATEDELANFFSQNGFPATSVKIILDKFSGRSRGFGFVELENADDLDKAISALDGQDFAGRTLVVKKARPQTERQGSFQQ